MFFLKLAMRIIDFFDQGVSLYADNLAFVEPGSEYTYKQASDAVVALPGFR